MKFEFSRQIFRKILRLSNCIKIRPLGAEWFHSDRHNEANSHLFQFRERAYERDVHKHESLD